MPNLTILSPPESLGEDLRVLRRRRGLTLAEVAGRVGRSVGWLSQVERHLSEPSPDELNALSEVLGVSPVTFAPRPKAVHVVRKAARRPLGPRLPGLREELLSPDLTDDFEVVHSTFEAGAERAEPVTRPTQEVGYIVSGRLEITIAGETYDLGPGDAFRIRGEPFRWANRADAPCTVVWVIAPPVY